MLTFGYDTSELLVIEDGAVDAAREWARRCFPKKKFRCWQDANTLSVMFEHSTKSDMEWLAKKIAPEVRTKARILPELSECVCESALLREKIVYLQEATKRDASISSPRSASGLVTRLETSMIEIHESEGRVGLTVQADTEEQFMAQFAQAAEEFLEGMAGNDERERARMLGKLLKPYNEVLCKLRGYKAIVTEHRVLSAGDFVSDNVKIVLDSDGNVRRFPVDKSDAKAAVG